MSGPAHARLTPFELVFGAELFEASVFPDIQQELEARGLETPPPERFLFLTTVGKLLRMIAGSEPPGGEPGGEAAADPGAVADAGEAAEPASSEGVDEYGALLYQAFRFWRDGRQLFVLEEGALRQMLDDTGAVTEPVRPPHPSGYVQLPRHLVWARAGEEQPEPVDGLFWAWQEADEGPHRLDVLLVLGMRPDRPGFSVVPVAAELEQGRPGDWGARARPGGEDFANVLPGGELDALFAVATPAEALKLAAVWFRWLERQPETLGGVERNPEDAAPASSHDLPPSDLAFRRVGTG